MNYIRDLFSNYWLVCAFSGWLVAQIIKMFTGFFKEQRFTVRAMLFGSGGMPSSHTSSAAALCMACGLSHGFDSALFAVTGVLLMIVMIDATGVRRETGKQSRALNQIVDELFSDNFENFNVHFKELIGHSPLQVFFGLLTGVCTTLLLSLIPNFLPPVS